LIIKSFLRSFALYLCSGMYRSVSSLRKWRQLVLVKCLRACPGTMRWLNCALVNSMCLTVVIRSENYQHHQHHGIKKNAYTSYDVRYDVNKANDVGKIFFYAEWSLAYFYQFSFYKQVRMEILFLQPIHYNTIHSNDNFLLIAFINICNEN
jgi:hypothetical protein